MAVNGAGAPTKPIGRPDILYGLPGQGGLLTEWAESVPDLTWPESIRTYGRMRRDPKLTAVLSAFYLPILRCTWAVDPAGVNQSEAVDLLASDLGLPVLGQKKPPADSPIRGFKWRDHVRLALLRLVYGHMPTEKWFEVRNGRTHLAGWEERQPHTIAMIDVDDRGQIREVTQNTQLEPIPANRLVWYINEREGANWAGVSLLRSCYTPWVLKHEVLRVHATSHRRWGMGVPVVNAPPGATPGQIEEARRLAAGMRAGDQAGAGLPDGFTFNLAGISGSVPDAVAFLNFLNQEMVGSALAKLLELGSTSEGSRALGDTFLDLFLLALQSAADAIGDTATWGDPAMPGVSRALTDYNWGEDAACPRIVATDVGDRHEITATAIQQLVACGAIQADDTLENYVREAWTLPKRTTPRTAPPAPGIPGTPGGRPLPGGGGGATQPPPGGQPGSVPGIPGKGPVPPAPAPTPAPARGPAPGGIPAYTFPAAAGPRFDGLRRDLNQIEAAAGVDPAGMGRDLDAARGRLLDAWAPVWKDQRAQLADQVAAAVDDGDVAALARIGPDPAAGAALLGAALRQVAARAAARMLGEARAQGVRIRPSKVELDEGRLDQIAQARAAMAAAYLGAQASRRALQVVTATAGTDAAGLVTATLTGLSPTSLADELSAALHAAENMGRFAVMDAGPGAVYYAAELRDDPSCCAPCKTIDGYQFADLGEARADYPAGAYVKCLGQLRCRGFVVARWGRPDALPPDQFAQEEDLYGPLGRYLTPGSWTDLGLAGYAGYQGGHAQAAAEPGGEPDGEPPPFGDADAAAGTFTEALHPRDLHGRFARKRGVHGPAIPGKPARPGRAPAGKLPWTVEGDTIRYAGSLNIPREDTPQFSGTIAGRYNPPAEVIPKFTTWLGNRGVATTARRVPSGSLKPIKASGSWKTVRGLADELKSGKRQDTKPLIVSADGYVIDGTQTWAARRLADAEGGRAGLPPGVPVLQVDLPAARLLPTARAFMAEIGMPTRKAGEVADPAYLPHGAPVPAKDTLVRYQRPDGTWDPQRARLHRQIVDKLLAGAKPSAHPEATFFGGGPASGKDSILHTPADTAVINPDDVKAMLPEYIEGVKNGDEAAAGYVHEESSYVSKMALAEAVRRRVPFVLNGTGDSAYEKLARKVNAARKAGYTVHGRYATIPTDEAVIRAKIRAAETGRHVNEPFIRTQHAGVSRTFAQAVENGLYDTFELWDNSVPRGRPPTIVVHGEGKNLTVDNPAAWQQFLDKARQQ